MSYKLNITKSKMPVSAKIKELFYGNGLAVGIVLLCVILTLTSPVFLTAQNLMNVLSRSAVTGVLAIGMTMVLISGGFDLSIANIASMSGLLAMGLINYSEWPEIAAIAFALAFGAFVGLINGVMITRLRVNPLISTISTMTIVQGLIWVYSNGANIAPTTPFFKFIGLTNVFGVNFLIIIWVILGILGALMLKWTKFGRNLYSVGGNEEASRLSGIKHKNVKMFVYVICGLLAAFAGLMLVGRLQAALPTAAQGQELTVIAAAVIGGTSIAGGIGNIKGTFMGVILVSLVGNAINLWGVPAEYNNVFSGAVIGFAALMDAFRHK